MNSYRLYVLDSRGKIRSASEFALESDEQAIARTQERRNGQPIELWSGTRVVARFGAIAQTEAEGVRATPPPSRGDS